MLNSFVLFVNKTGGEKLQRAEKMEVCSFCLEPRDSSEVFKLEGLELKHRHDWSTLLTEVIGEILPELMVKLKIKSLYVSRRSESIYFRMRLRFAKNVTELSLTSTC